MDVQYGDDYRSRECQTIGELVVTLQHEILASLHPAESLKEEPLYAYASKQEKWPTDRIGAPSQVDVCDLT